MTTIIKNSALTALALLFLIGSTAMAVPGALLNSLMADVNDEEAEYWSIDEVENNHSTSGQDEDDDDQDEGKPVFTTGG